MRTRGDLYKRFEDPNYLLILIPNSLLYLYKLKSLQIQILIWSLLSNALWYIYDLNGLKMYMHVHRFMNFNTKCFAVHELFRNNDKRSDKN